MRRACHAPLIASGVIGHHRAEVNVAGVARNLHYRIMKISLILSPLVEQALMAANAAARERHRNNAPKIVGI